VKSRNRNPEGRGLVKDIGVDHFGVSEGKGRLKCSCHPWYGMDIFWNYPIVFNSCLAP